MEKDNKNIKKRIMAFFASALLIFSAGNSNDAQLAPNANIPKVESEYNDFQNYNILINNYPDLKMTTEAVISLKDLLSLPVGEDVCDTMVPQGLAIKDGLILITAYDGIDGYKSDLKLHSYRKSFREKLSQEEEHEAHNSVIVVLDQNTKEILTTIELSDKNHVGGIAVDDENVYIAKSEDRNISVISLDKIKEVAKQGREGTDHTKVDYDYNMDCNCDASIVSLRETLDGKKQLLVGTWVPFPGQSILRIFDFGDNQNLILNQKFNVNSSCNGATFVKREGKEYLIASCSIGRSLDSNLYVYEVTENEKGNINLKLKSQSELPPMMEEIAEYTDEDGQRKLLINSEAFSTRYEIGRSRIISNGIIASDLDAILDKEGMPKRKVGKINVDVYKEDLEEPKKKKEDDEIDK